jgi:predicted nucleic acid-binding protein
MKCFLDTSVLGPVFLDEHPHHEASLALFLRVEKKHASCAAHSLAEVYSTLTRLPGNHRASASEAMLFLADMAERLAFISLDAEEYWTAITTSAESGIVGGTIYDALLAHCALKAKADIIYTWDLGHFQRLGSEVAKRVRTP